MDCKQDCCWGLLAKTLLVHIITHMKVKLREDFWKALLVWKLGYLSCTQLHVVEEACLGSLTMTSNTSVWPSTPRNNPYVWLLLSMQAYRELFLCSFWTLATTSSLRWVRGRSFFHTVCTYTYSSMYYYLQCMWLWTEIETYSVMYFTFNMLYCWTSLGLRLTHAL